MDSKRWNELDHRHMLFTKEMQSINDKLDAMPNRNREATPDEVRTIDGLVSRFMVCQKAVQEIDAEMYTMMREDKLAA